MKFLELKQYTFRTLSGSTTYVNCSTYYMSYFLF